MDKDVIVTIKRSVFPLTRFYFTLGNENYYIRSGEIKKINLSKEGDFEIIASAFWTCKKDIVFLKNKSILYIKHRVSDLYYIIGSSIIFILAILTFFGLFNVLWFSGLIIIYLLPIIFYTFLKPKDYFKFEVNNLINN